MSGDEVMEAPYLSGDPYLAFTKQAHAVPEDATKETHGPERDVYFGRAIWDGSRVY
jgi:hypothetical protein